MVAGVIECAAGCVVFRGSFGELLNGAGGESVAGVEGFGVDQAVSRPGGGVAFEGVDASGES